MTMVINGHIVSVPSGEPVIVDEEGSSRLRGLVGPFNEGDPLVLVCQSEQGELALPPRSRREAG